MMPPRDPRAHPEAPGSSSPVSRSRVGSWSALSDPRTKRALERKPKHMNLVWGTRAVTDALQTRGAQFLDRSIGVGPASVHLLILDPMTPSGPRGNLYIHPRLLLGLAPAAWVPGRSTRPAAAPVRPTAGQPPRRCVRVGLTHLPVS